MGDIETVALGKGQIRSTTKVEHNGNWFVVVEIQEPDPGAGMGSTGLRTVRKEVVAHGTVTDDPPDVAVVPSNDMVAHEHSRDCICGPSVQLFNGKEILVHQALDGRE